MNTSSDVSVLAKAEFTVTVVGGAIVIKDTGGKGGGNVGTNAGRKVSWKNDARNGKKCRLTFREFLDDDDDRDDPPAWPFTPSQNPWSNSITLSDQETWSGKLAKVAGVICFKYDIEFEPFGSGLRLDPIIIVRP